MKICVLIKQVASEDSSLIINNEKSGIESNGINLVTNEPDSYALEEALLLKEQTSGEVVICTLGPESCNQIIKDGLAKGADRAIHITCDSSEKLSPLNIAKIIAKKLNEENFDLILSGLQSNDYGYAQIGILISEILNCSHASLVMGTEILNDNSIKVKRELENGWFQWATLNLPASITIQSGINKPRYASLRGIMMMKKKPIDIKKLSTLDVDLEKKLSLKNLYVPLKSKETEKIEGSPDEIADRIHHILKEDLRLI